MTYDASGNVLSARDPNGVGYDAAYDELGRSVTLRMRCEAPYRCRQYHRLARWIVMFLATQGCRDFLFLVFWFGFASGKSKPKNKCGWGHRLFLARNRNFRCASQRDSNRPRPKRGGLRCRLRRTGADDITGRNVWRYDRLGV
jgi:YD repeat-containing protein